MFHGRLGALLAMKSHPLGLPALSLGVAAALAVHDAHAVGPLDVEVALKAGGGTPPGGDSPSPLAYSIGGRAGVAFSGAYGGLSLVNYFGESQAADPTVPGSLGVAVHALMFGAEGGYGWKLGTLTLRAQLGVGNFAETVSYPATNGGCVAIATGSACPPVVSRPSYRIHSLYLEPGVTAMISFGTVFVAADANVLVLPNRFGASSTDAAFTLHGQLGLKF
jgi:hypothetical protein